MRKNILRGRRSEYGKKIKRNFAGSDINKRITIMDAAAADVKNALDVINHGDHVIVDDLKTKIIDLLNATFAIGDWYNACDLDLINEANQILDKSFERSMKKANKTYAYIARTGSEE